MISGAEELPVLWKVLIVGVIIASVNMVTCTADTAMDTVRSSENDYLAFNWMVQTGL